MTYFLVLSLGIYLFWNGMFWFHTGFLAMLICFQMYVLLCVCTKDNIHMAPLKEAYKKAGEGL